MATPTEGHRACLALLLADRRPPMIRSLRQGTGANRRSLGRFGCGTGQWCCAGRARTVTRPLTAGAAGSSGPTRSEPGRMTKAPSGGGAARAAAVVHSGSCGLVSSVGVRDRSSYGVRSRRRRLSQPIASNMPRRSARRNAPAMIAAGSGSPPRAFGPSSASGERVDHRTWARAPVHPSQQPDSPPVGVAEGCTGAPSAIRLRRRSGWAAANKMPTCPSRRCRPNPPAPGCRDDRGRDGGADAVVERERVPHRRAAVVIRPVDDHKPALGGRRRNEQVPGGGFDEQAVPQHRRGGRGSM